ncbi:receptor-like serine/threonine-protein kinase SD1-8 isoform X1 [Quercus robur]|uniref:receptor-like serine/threonine-protein kinase SD1-8 isoform X1 n=1 Tax=Quercus robur TaxID=38942 RepID=UPI0021615FED|nr:receptor-like serine/threonine-protein kinase SD1-8 isoform X1 [Quercus robur]
MDIFALVFLSSSLLVFSFVSSDAVDSITQSQTLRDIENTTLVSKDGGFVLGFFSPGNSNNRYLGIWYNNIPVKTVVWVANRLNPIPDSSGVLMVKSSGSLVLLSQNTTVAWSANSTKEARNPIVHLLDSGNLVSREENEDNYLWQSFDYPSDTWLPGMKLGWDLGTGLEKRLTEWKSLDDPSPGEMSWGIELNNYPELVMKKGSEKYFRSGPWNGIFFSGMPELQATPLFNYTFVSNKDEVHFMFELIEISTITRVALSQSQYMHFVWVDEKQKWMMFLSFPKDGCDAYNFCGAYGNCIVDESLPCHCVEGFKPVSRGTGHQEEWYRGCVGITQLSCEDKDKIGFFKLPRFKMPATTYSWLNESMSLNECRVKCLNNCSCTAYANSDIRGGGSGCAIWFGDLTDIRQMAANKEDANSQDVYIRMPTSEQANSIKKEVKNKQKTKVVVIVVVAIAVIFGVLMIPYSIWKRSNFRGEDLISFDFSNKATQRGLINKKRTGKGRNKEMELPLFSFSSVSTATNYFSASNKLGEGGFGPVYKGSLLNGQLVAVKRLSRKSGQGWEELKNEAMLIAKLQHKNLVKLLGCCIERDEKILIYEYLPNKSLDYFLFDPIRHEIKDWATRTHIIEGIVQGLLYLHQYSRLQIIHRDLKASNILLDKDMNPKISDFGLARIFCGNGSQATNRIVGTYGYMSPEYAMEGLFSIKSDVFSFGVLLLEILSGKKNTGFYQSDSINLIGYTWDLWKSNRSLELMDPILEDTPPANVLLSYINIALLCVQENAVDRPTISDVISMFNKEPALLPSPKKPAFSFGRGMEDLGSSKRKLEICSLNDMTVSILEAR